MIAHPFGKRKLFEKGFFMLKNNSGSNSLEKRTIKDIPLEVIERWLKDSDCDVRSAAMNACQGKDIPLEVIERGLKDSDWRVRSAAMNWYKSVRMEIPYSRNFEPPKFVYKKCVAGVIVVAEIPNDAHVRGRSGQKCRASKAKIVDIIGTICGEQIGISKHDLKTVYFIGEEIEIDNFDFSDEECSTGFHFFCTQVEAERY
jgi:hypothetical protein